MARLGNKITVYGIEFKNLAEFSAILGYKANLSAAFVAKRYGTFEDMAKVRLRVDSDEQAKAKLLELMGQKEQPKEQKAYIDDGDPVLKCARAFVTACINKGLKDDKNLLDGLMMAFNISDLDAVRAQIDKIKAGL